VLPISVQGLGTTQAAMVFFFARYAPGNRTLQEATVISASLVGQTLALAFQATLGILCLKSRVGRALSDSVKADTEPGGDTDPKAGTAPKADTPPD
jgi:hypothetical protein